MQLFVKFFIFRTNFDAMLSEFHESLTNYKTIKYYHTEYLFLQIINLWRIAVWDSQLILKNLPIVKVHGVPGPK